QGLEGEGQVLVDIEAALLVIPVELLVHGPVVGGVHLAATGQELPPAVVAVPGDQGVVQVENCQRHRGESSAKKGDREDTHSPVFPQSSALLDCEVLWNNTSVDGGVGT